MHKNDEQQPHIFKTKYIPVYLLNDCNPSTNHLFTLNNYKDCVQQLNEDEDDNNAKIQSSYSQDLYLKTSKTLVKFVKKNRKGLKFYGSKQLENFSIDDFIQRRGMTPESFILKFSKINNVRYLEPNAQNFLDENILLTPIPWKSKKLHQNEKETNDFQEAERNAVSLRTYEYSHGLRSKKMSQETQKKMWSIVSNAAHTIQNAWWIYKVNSFKKENVNNINYLTENHCTDNGCYNNNDERVNKFNIELKRKRPAIFIKKLHRIIHYKSLLNKKEFIDRMKFYSKGLKMKNNANESNKQPMGQSYKGNLKGSAGNKKNINKNLMIINDRFSLGNNHGKNNELSRRIINPQYKNEIPLKIQKINSIELTNYMPLKWKKKSYVEKKKGINDHDNNTNEKKQKGKRIKSILCIQSQTSLIFRGKQSGDTQRSIIFFSKRPSLHSTISIFIKNSYSKTAISNPKRQFTTLTTKPQVSLSFNKSSSTVKGKSIISPSLFKIESRLSYSFIPKPKIIKITSPINHSILSNESNKYNAQSIESQSNISPSLLDNKKYNIFKEQKPNNLEQNKELNKVLSVENVIEQSYLLYPEPFNVSQNISLIGYHYKHVSSNFLITKMSSGVRKKLIKLQRNIKRFVFRKKNKVIQKNYALMKLLINKSTMEVDTYNQLYHSSFYHWRIINTQQNKSGKRQDHKTQQEKGDKKYNAITKLFAICMKNVLNNKRRRVLNEMIIKTQAQEMNNNRNATIKVKSKGPVNIRVSNRNIENAEKINPSVLYVKLNSAIKSKSNKITLKKYFDKWLRILFRQNTRNMKINKREMNSIELNSHTNTQSDQVSQNEKDLKYLKQLMLAQRLRKLLQKRQRHFMRNIIKKSEMIKTYNNKLKGTKLSNNKDIQRKLTKLINAIQLNPKNNFFHRLCLFYLISTNNSLSNEHLISVIKHGDNNTYHNILQRILRLNLTKNTLTNEQQKMTFVQYVQEFIGRKTNKNHDITIKISPSKRDTIDYDDLYDEDIMAMIRIKGSNYHQMNNLFTSNNITPTHNVLSFSDKGVMSSQGNTNNNCVSQSVRSSRFTNQQNQNNLNTSMKRKSKSPYAEILLRDLSAQKENI